MSKADRNRIATSSAALHFIGFCLVVVLIGMMIYFVAGS